MKNALLGVILVVATGAAGAQTSAVRPATMPPTGDVVCDVVLNVDDPDPKGLNVRAALSAKSGEVIQVLKPDGDWTQVHVVAQRGDWMKIDHAETIDDNAENGERPVFKGDGWVHVSKLGISELYVGEGTFIRDRPAPDGAVLLYIDNDEKEPKTTRVLGCHANYIEVDFDGKTGWTREFCTNERTTCS